MDRNQAQKNIWFDVILKRKRKLFDDMSYNDQQWNYEKEIDEGWITQIETYQSDKIPIKEFTNARSWIEYKQDYDNPHLSHYGCKRCRNNAKKFKIKPQFMPDFALDEGVLFPILEQNKNAIINHEKCPTHRQIESRLKQDQIKAGMYEDITYFEDSEILITSQVMRTVYTAIKHMGSSFNSIEYMVELQEQHNVDMGTACASRSTFTKMGATLGKSMHNRLTLFLKSSKAPLSIIVDASTDVSNNHLMAVIIQTTENEVPVQFFYALLPIGSDETAEAQTALLVDKLKQDEVFEPVKNKIVSFVSDGAAVTVGRKRGMAVRLKKIFGPKLVSVHCGAQRIELAFGHAMEEYDSFQFIEQMANKLFTYFSKSHTRFAEMHEFLNDNDLQQFRLSYIDKIRWVAHHRRAVKQIYDHLPEIVGYLEEVLNNYRRITNPSFAIQRSIKKAQDLHDFVTDKDAIILMVFNIDVQGVFATQSLVFQAKDDSVISFSRAKQEMVSGLDDLRYVDDKSELKKFLAAMICDDGNPCETIQGYEQSQFVTWRKDNGLSMRLDSKVNSGYEKLSEIKKWIYT